MENYPFIQTRNSTGVAPLENIMDTHTHSFSQRFMHHQLTHWFQTNPEKNKLLSETPTFDELCLAKTKPTNTLSQIYTIILDLKGFQELKFKAQWERDVNIAFNTKDWELSFALTHIMAMACKAQESNFKIITRWYKGPATLHTIYPVVLDKLFQLISKVTGIDIHPDLSLALISIPSPNALLKIAPRGFIDFETAAVGSVIPRHWKNTRSPTAGEWVAELNYIQQMEELLSYTNISPSRYIKVWTTWVLFKATSDYNQILAT
ncbi:hypothetical protein XELAEV_18044397mg [Xenopus laevis]|uniref:Uncharacterized protein n=1 Tax=Xenopus laevis TaxID=8355 RepID=A0A974BYE5_XENLA|nr:hypothetical protein XELAEV_18044397mg [Xenopus laevis]